MTFVDTWKQHDFAAVAASIMTRTPDDVRRALAKQGRGLNLDDLTNGDGLTFAEQVAKDNEEPRLSAESFE